MRTKLMELIADSRQLNAWGVEDKWGRIEDLADYLLANGVIVPPCKVGDTVYMIFNKKVYKGTVLLIRPFVSKDGVVFKGNIICEIEHPFLDDGKTMEHEFYVVFEKSHGCENVAYLTKEEAERALKERDCK